MISLAESWQAQRKQRQYEVVQRQQQVYEILEQFQQERRMKATELREDLRLFQLELQLNTQDFLSQVNSQRQLQAEQVMQHLHCFAQTLRKQTAQLIATNTADRAAVAQQLAQDLSEFHTSLSLSVTLLRQNLQQQMQDLRVAVQTIRSATQELLQSFQKERIEEQIQQTQALKDWAEALQIEVQEYLIEISLIRHDRAHELQTMLQQDCDRRHAEMIQLFQQFGQFRSELKAYHSALHQTVWGITPEVNTPNTPVERRNIERQIPSKAVEKRPATILQSQKAKTASASRSIGQQSNSSATQSIKRSAARTIKRPSALQTAKSKVPSNLLRTNSTQPSVPQLSLPARTDNPKETSAERLLPIDPIEHQVYSHIQQTHGARLTEIETALNINRFQAVDSLRSLIKKGLVTQRDRVYLIQEEMSL